MKAAKAATKTDELGRKPGQFIPPGSGPKVTLIGQLGLPLGNSSPCLPTIGQSASRLESTRTMLPGCRQGCGQATTPPDSGRICIGALNVTKHKIHILYSSFLDFYFLCLVLLRIQGVIMSGYTGYIFLNK